MNPQGPAAEQLRQNSAALHAYSALKLRVGDEFLTKTLQPAFDTLFEKGSSHVPTCHDMIDLFETLVSRLAEEIPKSLDSSIVSVIGNVYKTSLLFKPDDKEGAITLAATLFYLRFISPALGCPPSLRDNVPCETDDDRFVIQLLAHSCRMFQNIVNAAIGSECSVRDLSNSLCNVSSLVSCCCGSPEEHNTFVKEAVGRMQQPLKDIIENIAELSENIQWENAIMMEEGSNSPAVLLSPQFSISISQSESLSEAAETVTRYLIDNYDSMANIVSIKDPSSAIKISEIVSMVQGNK